MRPIEKTWFNSERGCQDSHGVDKLQLIRDEIVKELELAHEYSKIYKNRRREVSVLMNIGHLMYEFGDSAGKKIDVIRRERSICRVA